MRSSKSGAALLAAAMLLTVACGQAPSQTGGQTSAAATGSATSGGTAAHGKPILVGLTGPLSGASAQYGREGLKAAELVFNAVNAKGGIDGRPLKLVPEDDQGSPKQGAIVANKLASEQVAAVLAPDFSGACAAAMPVYERYRIPMITSICSAPSLANEGWKYFFRTVPSDNLAGGFVARYLTSTLHLTKIGLLDDQSTYGASFTALVAKALPADGGQVLFRDHIKAGEKDYTPALVHIKTAHPQAVVYGGYYPEYALLLKQSQQIGLQTQWIGSSMERPATIRIAGQASLGAMSAGYPSSSTLATAKPFFDAYRTTYKRAPGPMTELTYDAAQILVDALKTAGTTKEPQLRDALAKTTLDGASGHIAFAADGDRTTPYFQMYKVEQQHGKLVWVPLSNAQAGA